VHYAPWINPPATLLMWSRLRSPELAEDIERVMAGDRDIVRGSLDPVSDRRLTRSADVPGNCVPRATLASPRWPRARCKPPIRRAQMNVALRKAIVGVAAAPALTAAGCRRESPWSRIGEPAPVRAEPGLRDGELWS